jgi:fido (protein-threonine AMPylation protein)
LNMAFDERTMRPLAPLDELYVGQLHRRMFDNVWKCAGRYCQTQRNIRCDSREIVQRIPQLLANTRSWLEHKTFTAD